MSMPELIVDTARIRHNAQLVFRCAGGARVIGVVKGNGYGLGLVPYARTLLDCGVDMLAVAALDEALALRAAGIETDVLLMTPPADAHAARTGILQNVILAVGSTESAHCVQAASATLGLSARVHLCVDTGLGRHGFSAAQPQAVLAAAQEMENVRIEGIFSHFACAAGRKTDAVDRQLAVFLAVCAFLEANGVHPGMRHIAASCALLRFPQARLDAVRVGSAFLGRIPVQDVWGFQPVGWLRCTVEAVYTRRPGAHMGYGGAYTARREMRTAVLDAGYGCGFGLQRAAEDDSLRALLRHLARRLLRRAAPPLAADVRGVSCPLVGGVGFSSCIADVTEADCRPGDSVRLPVNPLWVDSGVRRTYICAVSGTRPVQSCAASF